MSWTVGTVTIDSDGVATGSGAALALYVELLAEEEAEVPLPDPDVPSADWNGTAAEWRAVMQPAVVQIKQRLARTARGTARGMIQFAVANVVVSGSTIS